MGFSTIEERFHLINQSIVRPTSESELLDNNYFGRLLDRYTKQFEEKRHLLNVTRHLHRELCNIARHLNSAYGTQLLIGIILGFGITVQTVYYSVYYLFVEIWSLRNYNVQNLGSMINVSGWSVFYFGKIFYVSNACNRASKEVKLRDIIKLK